MGGWVMGIFNVCPCEENVRDATDVRYSLYVCEV